MVVPAFVTATKNLSRKIKHTGEISVITNKIRKFFIFFIKDLPYRKSIMWGKSPIAHFPQKFSYAVGILKHVVNAGKPVWSVSRIVLERQFFLNIDNSINTETADSAIQPPVDVFVNFFTNFRVFPVQVRLFLMENMQVLFVRMSRKWFPYRSTEITSPVTGKFPFFTVFNIKEVSIFSIRILAGFLEPFVFI